MPGVFSIIIPTRNRPAFLREALQSVWQQQIADPDIIVVNDGDGGIDAIVDIAFRVLDNKCRGPVAARNLGVAEARHSYIAFLDDDDLWADKGHLAKAAKALFSGSAFTFSDGVLTETPGDISAHDTAFAFDADRHSLEKDNTILISSVCYRRDLHEALGAFDEALPYYWDWDWYLRVARAGHRLTRIAEKTVAIRIHPQNMSGAEREREREANLALLARKHGLSSLKLKNHLSLALEDG